MTTPEPGPETSPQERSTRSRLVATSMVFWLAGGALIVAAQVLRAPTWLILLILVAFPIVWIVVASWVRSSRR
jgi:hypothetical protein